MKTWLDSYIAQQDRAYNPLLRDHSKYGSRSPIKTAHWNLVIQDKWDEWSELNDIQREYERDKGSMTPAILKEYEGYLASPFHIRKSTEEQVLRMEREWVYMITPFLQPGPYTPLCLQITPELVNLFTQKRVEGWDSESFDLLEKHKAIYIDLPHNTIFVLPHLQIRALVIRDMRHGVKVSLDPKTENDPDRNWRWGYIHDPDGSIRVSAIITPRGSDREAGAIRWTLFSDELPEGFTLDDDEFDYGVFKSELEEFIKLVLAYFLLAPRKSQTPCEQIDLEDADRAERRAWEREKKWTLFGVTQLGLTNDQNAIQLVGGLRGSRKGWKLGVRIHIEPFERWQWKGKKDERYKEKILVGASEQGYWKGPIDAPLRLKLYSLS